MSGSNETCPITYSLTRQSNNTIVAQPDPFFNWLEGASMIDFIVKQQNNLAFLGVHRFNFIGMIPTSSTPRKNIIIEVTI